MLLYYITARLQFPGDEARRRSCLLRKIAEAARCGIDYIQLREPDLHARELENLAQQALDAVRQNANKNRGEFSTRLLINSRSDVALAVGADGVHLKSEDTSMHELRSIWGAREASQAAETQAFPFVSVSCHCDADVARAAAEGADLALFAPVFEKIGSPQTAPAGLEALHRACRYDIPVLALGGVTVETIPACLNSGAAGIAAIRLFQDNDIADLVRGLRA